MASVEQQILAELKEQNKELKKQTQLLRLLLAGYFTPPKEPSTESKVKFHRARVDVPRFAAVGVEGSPLSARVDAAQKFEADQPEAKVRMGDVLSIEELLQFRTWMSMNGRVGESMLGNIMRWYETLPESANGA